MVIHAETPRLVLRSLEESDLPRVVELMGDWDVARWLSVVPYPYGMKEAHEFYRRMAAALARGAPEYFLLHRKSDGAQLGAVGLHPPRENPQPGHMTIGYWLGKPYWGQGYMTEAVQPVIDFAFHRQNSDRLSADADPDNYASQNVLRKAGFACLGIGPAESVAQQSRGNVTRWQLLHSDYQAMMKVAS